MKKIKKEHFIGFIIGLSIVLIIDIMLHHQKYIDAFKDGYQQVHKSEITKRD